MSLHVKLFILALFFISTLTTALHELEHIHAHDSKSCQICIIDDHSNSFDINEVPKIDEFFHHITSYSFTCKPTIASYKHFPLSRAPPFS